MLDCSEICCLTVLGPIIHVQLQKYSNFSVDHKVLNHKIACKFV